MKAEIEDHEVDRHLGRSVWLAGRDVNEWFPSRCAQARSRKVPHQRPQRRLEKLANLLDSSRGRNNYSRVRLIWKNSNTIPQRKRLQGGQHRTKRRKNIGEKKTNQLSDQLHSIQDKYQIQTSHPSRFSSPNSRPRVRSTHLPFPHLQLQVFRLGELEGRGQQWVPQCPLPHRVRLREEASPF